jgi:hypothetical protein
VLPILPVETTLQADLEIGNLEAEPIAFAAAAGAEGASGAASAESAAAAATYKQSTNRGRDEDESDQSHERAPRGRIEGRLFMQSEDDEQAEKLVCLRGVQVWLE